MNDPIFVNQRLSQVSLKFLATHPYNRVWSLNWKCFTTVSPERRTSDEIEELFQIVANAHQQGLLPDLHCADLHCADLHGANLHGANLHGANLHGANLHGANLSGADLCGADLRWADLRDANLCGANLCGADLRWANLRWANLNVADLSGADLSGADLSGADLSGAYLDFAVWPLWCGGTWVKLDRHLSLQLIYHVFNNDHLDPEIVVALEPLRRLAEEFRTIQTDAPELRLKKEISNAR
jgi:hypothetical protein